MKKRILSLIVLSLFALPLTNAYAIFGLIRTFKGQVQYIDTNVIAVTHEKDNQIKEMVFQVKPETKLHEDSSLDNLRIGDHVKVQYKEEEDSKIAVAIDKLKTAVKTKTTVTTTTRYE
ncbi:MAG: hypothetical protein KBD53_06950 [Candidatus Omnitrophica bacterium]|nr:hypothetical protein [Candidatus Omnitrophota bacterium]